MLYRLLRRTTALIATLVVISLVVFFVMAVVPGDPALVVLGIEADPGAVEALRRQLGLEAPLHERYFRWISGVLRGDFGTSLAFRVPVRDLILERLPMTVTLGTIAMVATVLLAVLLGMFAAASHRGLGDWAVMVFAQLGLAVPAFWLAILLVILFAVHLRWFPPGGFPGWDDPLAALRALILPATALTLVQAAVLARVTRSAALEVMRLDFVRTARALGLSRVRILGRHVLPNALIPIITIVGLQFAALVTGTIVIENVFYLPGLGRLMFQAIGNRDLPTVQALVLLFAAIVVIVNYVVDVLYVLIDPRLRTRL